MTESASSSDLHTAESGARETTADVAETPQNTRTEDVETVLNSDSKWEQCFQRLLAYRAEHGDTLVPNRFPPDPSLGQWVTMMRRQYKIRQSGLIRSSTLEQRIQRLQEIDFQWTTRDPRHVPWESRYEELVEFSKRFGHAQVPIGWQENVKLSNWVSTQRQEYKMLLKGRATRLTASRIDKLNKINFIWEAQRGGPRRSKRAIVNVPRVAFPVDVSRKQSARFDAHVAQGLLPGLPVQSFVYGPALIHPISSDLESKHPSTKQPMVESNQVVTKETGTTGLGHDHLETHALQFENCGESSLATPSSFSPQANILCQWHVAPGGMFQHSGVAFGAGNIFPFATPFAFGPSAAYHYAMFQPALTVPVRPSPDSLETRNVPDAESVVAATKSSDSNGISATNENGLGVSSC